MAKYKRRSITVEAFQWTGYDPNTNPKWFTAAQHKTIDEPGACRVRSNDIVEVLTTTGVVKAHKNDFIIRSDKGDLYPCNPHLFRFLHDEITE